MCMTRYKELYKALAKQKMQKKITDLLVRKDSNDANNNKEKTLLNSNVFDVSDTLEMKAIFVHSLINADVNYQITMYSIYVCINI